MPNIHGPRHFIGSLSGVIRALRKSLAVIAAVVVLVLIVGIIAVVGISRRPLPNYGGELTASSLSQPVTVHRDDQGVPQIYAKNSLDLFRAQGFVHAQDRFFEMDYRRHVTAGRLSELTGENADALAADKMIRTMGWRKVAEEEWELLDPDTKSYLSAYADGVNDYISSRSPGELGMEYTVLDVQVTLDDIEPWTEVDSLAWLKAMAWDLKNNFDQELERALIMAEVNDLGRVNEIFPDYDEVNKAPILPDKSAYSPEKQEGQESEDDEGGDSAAGEDEGGAADLAVQESSEVVAAAQEALDAVPTLLGKGDGIGSNSWVVSGEHTESGMPLLANDPHLGLDIPSIWHQVGLHCEPVGPACPFDVSGFDFAGFPSVIIGHNDDLGWGFTNLAADVTDFFLEHTADGQYLRDGEYEPLEIRTETIKVADSADVELEIQETVHGPIVSDVLDDARRASRSPVPEDSPFAGAGRQVALSWTALEPGGTANAVFKLAVAKDADDIAEAASKFEVPSQNIVFATTEGDIGYQAPGRIPMRDEVPGPVPSDGSWPRPGWDSKYDWNGWIDSDDMPAALNPKEGFIVAANQAVTGKGMKPFLSNDWDYGQRSERIRDEIEGAIESGTKINSEMTNELQNDNHSEYFEVLKPYLLDVQISDSFVREAVDLLRDWDGQQDPDSAAAAYFNAVWANILSLTFTDELPPALHPSGGSRWLAVMENLLEDPDNEWWDDVTTRNIVESRDEILASALTDARYELTVKLGKDPEDWQWGRLHQLRLEHPILGGNGLPGPVRALFNPDPVEIGGGTATVNAIAWNAANDDYDVTAGPSMRMVLDFADLDKSTWVNVTGVSGHPGSEHYTDQYRSWIDGEQYPWPFSQQAVEEAASSTMTLIPEKKK